MPNWQDILKFFGEGWHVIRDAPGPFALCVIMAGLILWGALSWKFDAQIASRDSIIGARDATIKFQDALIAEYKNRMQIPTETGEDRKLAPEQKRILGRELKAKIDKFPRLIIYAVSEREPRQYAKQFAELAQGIGIDVIQREIPSSSTSEVGLFVGLRDTNNPPPDAAQEFMTILNKANLEAHYTIWMMMASPEEKDAKFDLYVARPFW
jgi:hypothetical protein